MRCRSWINSPGGNDVIDATLNGLNQHKMERARVAGLALAGEIKPSDAMKQLNDLSDPKSDKNPYNIFKAYARNGFKPPDAAPDTASPAAASAPPVSPAAAPQMSPADASQSIANARAKIARSPGSRDAVIRQLNAAGIPVNGL